jgi:2,3-bisphosphoglycerate-dependent phosphoglycerate mutase
MRRTRDVATFSRMTIRLVYETHSITEDNESGHATGWLPGRLSAAGRDAARVLGERRRDVDVVVCSDLARAAETATTAFEGMSVPVLLDWRLRECDYGSLNGAPHAEVQPRAQFLDTPHPGGGETWRAAVVRNLLVLPDLRLRWDGLRVLLIGHAATRFALRAHFDGSALDDIIDADFAWQPGWEYSL